MYIIPEIFLGLLHAAKLQPINSAISQSQAAGLPFVGISFQCVSQL